MMLKTLLRLRPPLNARIIQLSTVCARPMTSQRENEGLGDATEGEAALPLYSDLHTGGSGLGWGIIIIGERVAYA